VAAAREKQTGMFAFYLCVQSSQQINIKE